MEKLKMQTTDVVDENIKRIGEMFPNCLTETLDENGRPQTAIDFDQLRQELSKDIVEGPEERYQFTWPDKRNAIRLANAPTTDTLRPRRKDSVDFDNTKNLYIEGDNLEVLKLLRQNYLGKVKMIYIDPPYNTGNDFVYNDNFDQDKQEYVHNSGQYDEQGNQLVTNTESNGRFHTDWLNMIYPRLKVAKDLLSEDGVIFISIDDNEVENLRKVCDEIFGSINFASPFIWSLPRGINAGLIARAHEYILCYTKNIFAVGRFNRLSDDVEYSIERCNKKIDSRHPESTIDFPSGIRYEGPDKTLEGEIEGSETIRIIGREVFKNGSLVEPVTLSAGWTMKNMILDWLAGREVYDTKGQKIVEFFFKDNGKLYSKKELNTYSIKSILKDIADTQKARIEIEELFGNQDIFSYPKTVDLPKLFSKLSTNKDSVILDFFSGSATTAHAVMQLNAEDGGNRKFIMVQLPEPTDEKSEAYKAGYKNICEIGKERIRRAGKKIKEEHPETKDLDTGFRVLKLDSSNMQDVFYTPEEFTEHDLFENNIKGDRTEEDLLFQVMIELGIELSAKIEKQSIAGKTVWNVSDGYLMACFDEGVNESTIKEIAKKKPFYFVMRDSSMQTDNVADNFEQIWSEYSNETVRRIL
jgi:adenine-specific DNA-methyltransferase